VLNHPNISPWPYYETDEIDAAMQTLNSGKVNYWTGELGKQFEQAYAAHVGKQFGIALSNGTVALELALRALGIGEGDEVIVASRSYVASASCVKLVGAIPVFADIDSTSGNICVETIKPLISDKTKAVIPVHIGGWPCDMQGIMNLANLHGIKVIEDCAQAHGAFVANQPVGAWGHAAIFSFCQDKIISTGGEGGMLLLDDEAQYKKAWAYKDIGRDYDAVYHKEHPAGFRWLVETAGSNFRMTEFQAAIGLKQLAKLPQWIAERNKRANHIIKTLNTFDFIETPVLLADNGNQNAYYRLYSKVKMGAVKHGLTGGALRDYIIEKLILSGVPCFSGSCAEIYRERLFDDLMLAHRLPNAAIFADYAFCFLVHHTISGDQLDTMTQRINRVFSELEANQPINP
jgi:dTDP-4-amino-4,6-dideoxygalactose transaminase